MALLKAFGIFGIQYLIATFILNSSQTLTNEFVNKPRFASANRLGIMAGLPILGGWMPTGPAPVAAPPAPGAPTAQNADVVGYAA